MEQFLDAHKHIIETVDDYAEFILLLALHSKIQLSVLYPLHAVQELFYRP